MLSCSSGAYGDDGAVADPAPSLWEEAWAATKFDFKAVELGNLQRPSMGDPNPHNVIYEIPRWKNEVDLRPRFSLRPSGQGQRASIEPRFIYDYKRYEDGIDDGTKDTDSRGFISRYEARSGLGEYPVYLSFSRNNLQWGPAYYTTVSNPFFTDNEQIYPFEEKEASDFFTATWTPNDTFSIDYFFNYDDGFDSARDPGSFSEFRQVHALKADLFFYSSSFSVIAANREESDNMLGAYGQWTVAEPVVLYFDSALRRGSRALYPQLDATSPVGGEFVATREEDHTLKPEILLGGSYTTTSAYTIYLEYLYYSPGYTDSEVDAYRELVSASAQAVNQGPQGADFGAGVQNLGAAYFDGLRFRGRHMLMFQVTKDFGRLSVVAHHELNAEDLSASFYHSLLYRIGRHKFLGSFEVTTGNHDDEYRSGVDYITTLGYMLTL